MKIIPTNKILYGILMSLVLSYHLLASMAIAQSTDEEPPLIEHEILPYGIHDNNQSFSSSVSDNIGVADVELHYRLGPDGDFNTAPMLLQDSSSYSATIELVAEPGNILYYFIVAIDKSGNRAQKGFSFAPLVRELVSQTVAELDQPIPTTTMKKRNWVYIALGVLAAGVLAAAAGGGSGGNTGPCAADGCTLTLNLPSPQ